MKSKLVSRMLAILAVLSLVSIACNLPGNKIIEPAVTQEDIPFATEPWTAVPASATVELMPPTKVPDVAGLMVAYTSSENLYLFFDGKTSKLVGSGDVFHPRISPDGSMIAFLRPADDFHLEIWCINRDGSDERRLVSAADMDKIGGGFRDPNAVAINPFSDYGWVPGTHRLAFTAYQLYQGPGVNFLNDLTLVDADSGEIIYLFLPDWGGQFVFSPDGMHVAISQPDSIMIANIQGGDYRTALTYDPVTTYSEYRYYAKPTWAPDSSYLIVPIPPIDPLAMPAEETELWRLYTDSSPAELLGSVNSVPFIESSIVYSSDLKQIAFITGSVDDNRREIHVAKFDGSGDSTIDQGSPIILQSWSPDSSRVAYSIGQEEELWIGSLADTPQDLGLIFSGAKSLTWIDNENFLFWLPTGKAYNLWVGNLNGAVFLVDDILESPPSFSIWIDH